MSVEGEFEKWWHDNVRIEDGHLTAKAAYLAGRDDERKMIQSIIYDQTEKYNRDTMANLADLIERQEGI